MSQPSKTPIIPNSEAFEREVLIAPSGFREYDARWLYPSQINQRGMILLGECLGDMLVERYADNPEIVVGHDYRSYSADLKHALVIGLMAAGARVMDIGLTTTPGAYFAQFDWNIPAVAMVTASHNENGWMGVKMGLDRPLTFGPEQMRELNRRVVERLPQSTWTIGLVGGKYTAMPDNKRAYIEDLVKDGPLKRKLKVVVSCGNGTAAAFAPDVFRELGCEVVEQNCTLDYTFPNHNPNPEDLAMLHAIGDAVRAHQADIGFGFDGDGDRCGVVDNTGAEIFADKIGVLLARYMSRSDEGNKKFVVDVKSTGLYTTDPVLKAQGATVEYWMTGHTYMKRRVNETRAVAAFEKSGHFFFNAPYGRGYDDGLLSAIQILRMIDEYSDKTMADLYHGLPQTWLSPSMNRVCADEQKYDVVRAFTTMIEKMKDDGGQIVGHRIVDTTTVNGVRFTLDDGTWGLFRASSNKPEVVIVVESPVSEDMMFNMFEWMDDMMSQNFSEIGEYNQKITRRA